MHGLYWNLIMQTEGKIDAISSIAQTRPLLKRCGMYSGQLWVLIIFKNVYYPDKMIFLFVCFRNTYFRNCKTSKRKRYDKTNVFNIYCLGKMQKWYTHNAFNQEGTKDTWATTEKTDVNQMRFFHLLFYPTIFIWIIKKANKTSVV